MNFLQKLRGLLLRKKPLTPEPPLLAPHEQLRVDELPPFDLRVAELMRFDPQIRLALSVRNGLMMHMEMEFRGPREDEVAWVRRQWETIWNQASVELLLAKLYGFVPFEVMYREVRSGPFDGALEVARLIARHPRHVRPLMRHGEIAGFAHSASTHKSDLRLLAPKGLVVTFGREFGNPFGCSLLERAYPCWYEKWMDGGAKKLLRQRMLKDAYVGDILWYPPETEFELPSGESILWRDLAVEILEARRTGSPLALPLLYDNEGRKLLDYSPPQVLGGATQIFDWKRDLDHELWKALEVPPEVLEASGAGSGYAGRTIPLYAALAAVQGELVELVQSIDRDVLRPVAHLNFGRVPEYQIRPLSLIETFAAKLKGERHSRPHFVLPGLAKTSRTVAAGKGTRAENQSKAGMSASCQ